MNKLFATVAAAFLLAACNPNQNNSQNTAPSAPPAASDSAAAKAEGQQPPAIALPADVKGLEAAAAKAVEGYQPAAEKQVVYFDKDGKPADKPSPGGYYREVLGAMPDGRLVVQDFYQDNGKPQTLPSILKQGAEVHDFSGGNIEGLLVWLQPDGSIHAAAEVSQGKSDWNVFYRDGRILAQISASNEQLVLFYADGRPMLWGRKTDDGQKIMDTYYSGGGRMSRISSRPGQKPEDAEVAAWDRQGKPAALPDVREDMEAVMSALKETMQYIEQNMGPTADDRTETASAPH